MDHGGTAEPGIVARAFFGRTREVGELRAALGDTRIGRGRVFVISGEPGVGKTRLAEEISYQAPEYGAHVIWGRCWEGEGTPAYWPIIQILRGCSERPNFAQVVETLGSGIAHVASLIPDLVDRFGSRQEKSSSDRVDSEQARFRLFDAVATLVKRMARSEPLLVIIDDLHEADHSSLEMLKLIARSLTDSHIMIVATHRDAEVRRSPHLSETIAELLRYGRALPLVGLDLNDVARMVAQRAQRSPSNAFASQLQHITGGNPLFVDGIVRVLVAERKLGKSDRIDLRDFKLPEDVRGAIRKRLALLSGEARSALAVAAVIGHEFDLVLLERVIGESAGPLAELMREAAEIDVVATLSREAYQFTHPLIREALQVDSTEQARARLHRVIGEALEELHAANLKPRLTALANHFREAGLVEKAIDYTIQAGEAAYAVFAFEDASSHWQAALELFEAHHVEGERRAALLERLGDPMLLGVEPKGVEYLEEALRFYTSTGKTHDAARLHLKLGNSLMGMKNQVLRDIPRASTHLRQAEAALGQDRDEPLLGWLHILLAAVACELLDGKERMRRSRLAMSMGDRLGNELLWIHSAVPLADALTCQGQLRRGSELFARAWERADRLNDAGPCSAVAAAVGYFEGCRRAPAESQRWLLRELEKERTAKAPSARQQLLHALGHTLIVAGKPTEAATLVSQAECLCLEGIVHFCRGEWESAETTLLRDLEQQALKAGRRWQEFLALLWLAKLRRVGGRFEEAEDFLKRAIDIVGNGHAVVIELDARQELISLLGEIGVPKRAHQHLARCREIMRPREDWCGLAGAVARAEAIVATSEGRLDDAEAQFTKANEIFQRYDLSFDEAEALHYWGRALMAMGQSDRAVAKLDAAIEIYRRRGAGQRWIDRVESDKQTSRTSHGEGTMRSPKSPAEAAAALAVFKREGELWTLAYRGAPFRLKHAKGLQYIACLLEHPGKRVHVLDLVSVVEGVAGDAAASIGRGGHQGLEIVRELGDTAGATDSRARAEYSRTLRELREELDEVQRNNDYGRAERIREQIDAISAELSAATGFGRRHRDSTSHLERARGMVSKRIRATLGKIREHDSALGRHLSAAVKTGYFCAYLPDPDQMVTWHL